MNDFYEWMKDNGWGRVAGNYLYLYDAERKSVLPNKPMIIGFYRQYLHEKGKDYLNCADEYKMLEEEINNAKNDKS
jgi:hypothetical protein